MLGAVPPAALAAQLLVLHKHESGQPRRGTASARSRTAPRRRATGPRPAVPDADLLIRMRQFEQTQSRLSKRQVMKRYRVGDDRALRLLKKLHPETTPAPANGAVLR